LKTDPRDGVENWGRGVTAWTVDGRLSGGTGHSSQSEACELLEEAYIGVIDIKTIHKMLRYLIVDQVVLLS
jgi:hypothetical protein